MSVGPSRGQVMRKRCGWEGGAGCIAGLMLLVGAVEGRGIMGEGLDLRGGGKLVIWGTGRRREGIGKGSGRRGGGEVFAGGVGEGRLVTGLDLRLRGGAERRGRGRGRGGMERGEQRGRGRVQAARGRKRGIQDDSVEANDHTGPQKEAGNKREIQSGGAHGAKVSRVAALERTTDGALSEEIQKDADEPERSSDGDAEQAAELGDRVRSDRRPRERMGAQKRENGGEADGDEGSENSTCDEDGEW